MSDLMEEHHTHKWSSYCPMCELEKAVEIIERLRAVVDAARPYMCAGDDCTCDLCIAIRTLDGEP